MNDEQSLSEGFGRNKRIEMLDLLRGIALIYVMFYHLCYDLAEFADVSIACFGSAWFEAIHKAVLALLIIVSGICSSFSHDTVRRGAELFFMGSIFTIVTDLFVHDQVAVFGVLSFFGVMMMLCGLAKPLFRRIDWRILLAVSLILYFVTVDFADERGLLHLFFTDVKLSLPENTQYSYMIGILPKKFFSSDYFPLIPNGFIFIEGLALSHPIAEKKFPCFFYKHTHTRAINFIGKYSLWFYVFHQPIFLGILFLFLKG